jgi:hypothetical protein
MSIIVEDGTVVIGAESYITLAEADIYHRNRGMTTWDDMTDTEKEQALRRATSYMVGRYRSSWKGGRININQPLDWPRQGVSTDDFTAMPHSYYAYFVPYNVVPIEVKNACAELALRAGAGPMVDDVGQNIIQETVGPITTKYDPNSSQLIRYVQVDDMLSVYLKGGGNQTTVRLQRV